MKTKRELIDDDSKIGRALVVLSTKGRACEEIANDAAAELEALTAELKELRREAQLIVEKAQKVVSVGKGHAAKERSILIEAAIKELEAALKAGVK